MFVGERETESVAAGESARAGGCREGFPVASFFDLPPSPALGCSTERLGHVLADRLRWGSAFWFLFGGERGGIPFQTHTPRIDAAPALSHEAPIATTPWSRKRSAEKKTLPRIYIFTLCEFTSQPINTGAQHHSFASGNHGWLIEWKRRRLRIPLDSGNRAVPSLESGTVTCLLNGKRPVPFSPATWHLNPIRLANAGHYLDSPV